MLMLLFVNKPITLISFILGLCLIVLLSFHDGIRWFFTVGWLLFAFCFFYCTAVPSYFLLKGNQKMEIRGVDIRVFKRSFNIYIFMSTIGLIIASIIFSFSYIMFPAAAFLGFYNAIAMAVFRGALYAKFVSYSLKNNAALKPLEIEELYVDIRQVLLKKIIA